MVYGVASYASARWPAQHPPVPPRDFPPARTVIVPDRGEFFLRDTGGPQMAPVVLMLHGWIGERRSQLRRSLRRRDRGRLPRDRDRPSRPRARAAAAGPFRLLDCAADAAAVIRTLDLGAVIVYGYSMGGAIAQLIARDHPDVVDGLVLSGTAQHWQEQELRRYWKAMPLLGLRTLACSPPRLAASRSSAMGSPLDRVTAWLSLPR